MKGTIIYKKLDCEKCFYHFSWSSIFRPSSIDHFRELNLCIGIESILRDAMALIIKYVTSESVGIFLDVQVSLQFQFNDNLTHNKYLILAFQPKNY